MAVKVGPKMIFSSDVLDVHTTDKEGAGTCRMDEQGNIYRYVYNATGVATVLGDVLFHGDGTANPYTGASPPSILSGNAQAILAAVVQAGQTNGGDSLGLMAGVTMGAMPIAGYGWIHIEGYKGVIAVAGGGTAIVNRDFLIGSSGHSYAIHGVATGTAPLYKRGIIALAASTTTNTIAGIIQCGH